MTLAWIKEAQSLWAPPPDLKVSEWSDRYRMLSSEASGEPGRWITDRAPYQRGIMDALNDPLIELVVAMCSAQVGKTEILLNIIGYYISQDPSPILLLQPTLEMAEAFSKDRLATMIRDTPALQGKVKDARSRDSGNTLLHKVFPGGQITLAGANSPASLASRPKRIILCDEVDRYNASAGAEGDPVRLAFKRTTNFWNRKHVMVSTPTIKDLSRIELAYNQSDQRHFWLPCPICNHFQIMAWKQLDFSRGVDNTFYKCINCESELTDSDKPGMLARGEWRAEKPGGNVAGFHLSELYSPWVSWCRMAANWLEAQGSPETLRVFINTSLGESWELHQAERLNAEGLFARREEYAAQVPRGALVLTAGVDGQSDRLECTVMGWGFDGEMWIIEHKIFRGDPTSDEEVWKDLDAYLAGEFAHETGMSMKISTACIDTGGKDGYTPMAYSFLLNKAKRKVWGVKGSNQRNAPIAGQRPSRNNRLKVPVWMVGTDTAKDWIYPHLRIENPGRGYIHLPLSVDEEYCDQLTVEKLITRYHKGVKIREYIKPAGARNESLDCMVYGLAAFTIFNPKLELFAERIAEFKAKSDPIGPQLPPDWKPPEDSQPEPEPESPPPAKPFVPKRKGWLKRPGRW